jgi:glyoxylase-like metal-dependent hydrolase (beta-lactamase superfamily II)
VFIPPVFGVTVLGSSHGFDPHQSTSGFVLWIHGKGVMVDPPPDASDLLRREGISPRAVTAIVLTHCHADHDAGTFQKVLVEGRVQLFTCVFARTVRVGRAD